MRPIDYELEYNSRKSVPEHVELARAWDEQAAAYRERADADYDISYGPTERSRFDFFRGHGADGGEAVAVYIHGGYWRSRDRKTFSHVAASFNPRGISVAIPSYDHCPHVTILEIVAQMRAFLVKLWQMTGRRPAVAGHSAGGHLTAALFATDWSAVEGAPDDLVRAAYVSSGLFDLRPLGHVSVNADLRLTDETAVAASPLFWPVPLPGRELAVTVGGEESGEFRRQSRVLADTWKEKGVNTDFFEVPGANHFTILNALTAPGSPYAARIAAMAEAVAHG